MCRLFRRVMRCSRMESALKKHTVSVVLLLGLSLLTSACFKRPDFLIRVDPAVVPLVNASRAEISNRVAELESQVAAGRLRGNGLRDANRELEQLRTRLEKGDFKTGDQLIVTVSLVEAQVDTATVRDDMAISLRALPDASVAGVLRSELQQKMQAHVNRYLVDHTVRTNILTNVSLLGGVGRPGFYGISPDRPVTELITMAGGPGPLAKLDDVSVRRDGRLIVKPSMWTDAVKSGTTVAQLGLISGDVVEVGMKKERNIFQIVQVVAFASTGIFAFIQLLQFIYREPE